jgi:hypothetical protein
VYAGLPRSDLKLEGKGHQMSVQMVQSRVKPESVADVLAAAKRTFAAIDAAQPEGIRYASCLLPDGETFIALLEGVEASRAEPPNVQPLTVIGSYRLL